jgi:SAM-dependent methyltransferase
LRTEVVVASAEALPFAGRVFDAALSQLVVNFMADPEAGVREMARVTRPGVVVAPCVWDYAGEITLLRAFWDAAREVDREGAAAADEGAVMRWCAEGELAELWRDAGLEDVRFGRLPGRFRGALSGTAPRLHLEVREIIPGERFVMATSEGPFPMETTYTWEDAPSGRTRMTLRNRGEPSGFSRLMTPLVATAMRRANRKDLRRLRSLLEA